MEGTHATPRAIPRHLHGNHRPKAVALTGLTAPRVLLVIFAWFVIRVLTISCPRCSRPLGAAALAALIGKKNVNRCPQCRVSLDEPVKTTDRD